MSNLMALMQVLERIYMGFALQIRYSNPPIDVAMLG
jgi:hypothetical protein